jgi:hypothetical protein
MVERPGVSRLLHGDTSRLAGSAGYASSNKETHVLCTAAGVLQGVPPPQQPPHVRESTHAQASTLQYLLHTACPSGQVCKTPCSTTTMIGALTQLPGRWWWPLAPRRTGTWLPPRPWRTRCSVWPAAHPGIGLPAPRWFEGGAGPCLSCAQPCPAAAVLFAVGLCGKVQGKPACEHGRADPAADMKDTLMQPCNASMRRNSPRLSLV